MTQPVIIVGAPRSGTNILRDVLSAVPGFSTWPCDEINLVWKHYNRSVPHDQLTAAHARPEVRDYVRRQFEHITRGHAVDFVVEKTCATSLRVEFTSRILPDAKYIFIRRDGLDAAASTVRRWDAPFDARYVLRKLRFAPTTDLPFYAGQFVKKRLASRRAARHDAPSATRRVESWWGPKPEDFLQLQERHALDELAVIQWQRCVDLAQVQLAELDQAQVHEVVYEDFARHPEMVTSGVLDFLGAKTPIPQHATAAVSSSSIGKGRATFSSADIGRLTDIAGGSLRRLGYA